MSITDRTSRHHSNNVRRHTICPNYLPITRRGLPRGCFDNVVRSCLFIRNCIWKLSCWILANWPFRVSVWAVWSSRTNNSLKYRITTVWGQYTLSLSPPGGQPYESSQQNLGYVGITSSGWVPILPQQPRVVYSMQQCLPMSNIPTTPAIVTVSQVQALSVVCQP